MTTAALQRDFSLIERVARLTRIAAWTADLPPPKRRAAIEWLRTL